MKRYCLALDLKDDPKLIAEYERWHAAGAGWPEVRQNDLNAGIIDLQIYRTGTRMFMIMETDDDFSFEKKAATGCYQPTRAGMGTADVGLPATPPQRPTRRKMGPDGQDIPV